jgi:hypothetical protein
MFPPARCFLLQLYSIFSGYITWIHIGESKLCLFSLKSYLKALIFGSLQGCKEMQIAPAYQTCWLKHNVNIVS